MTAQPITARQKLSPAFQAATVAPALARQLGAELIDLLNTQSSPDAQQIKDLCTSGADLALRDAKQLTPLLIAAGKNQTDAATTLVDAGAGINDTTKDGNSVLMLAVLHKNHDLAKHLLEAGVAPDQSATKGLTPLMWAANLGDKDMCYLLLDYGADLNMQTPDGRTARDLAKDNNRPWLADKLSMYAEAVRQKKEAEQQAADAAAQAHAFQQAQDAFEAKLQAGLPTVNPVTVMKKITIRKNANPPR